MNQHKDIKIFVLSGGEENEIKSFLKRHYLLNYFEEILASKKNKLEHLINKKVGENDIFMINNRSGKKFKIAMIPV